MLDGGSIAQAPIHAINSGPAMAPVSGRAYSRLEDGASSVIIADTGGTTYDVSLVRDDRIPMTREMWVGQPFRGHMTGFPSVDVKSIGAGGGSIAWVDAGGVLHVGPQSAGAEPGPACYGRGGDKPTLTDACLVLGYLDAGNFLGGEMQLDIELAKKAIIDDVAATLELTLEEAAWSIVDLATENMTQAIVDITVNQGIDPSEALLIGGGGAAGLNSTLIARRLGSKRLLMPETGAGLSAAGAVMSDLAAEYRAAKVMTTDAFDINAANDILDSLVASCEEYANGPGSVAQSFTTSLAIEARYPSQVWEIEVPLPVNRFGGEADIEALKQRFHEEHERLFAIRDKDAEVEIVNWIASTRGKMRSDDSVGRLTEDDSQQTQFTTRKIYFGESGIVEAEVYNLTALKADEVKQGPAVIESPFTTIVVDPGARYFLTGNGNLIIEP